MEWDDPQPGLIVEEIEVKRGRNRSAHLGHIDAPVREEQVVPRLGHEPRRFVAWAMADAPCWSTMESSKLALTAACSAEAAPWCALNDGTRMTDPTTRPAAAQVASS